MHKGPGAQGTRTLASDPATEGRIPCPPRKASVQIGVGQVSWQQAQGVESAPGHHDDFQHIIHRSLHRCYSISRAPPRYERAASTEGARPTAARVDAWHFWYVAQLINFTAGSSWDTLRGASLRPWPARKGGRRRAFCAWRASRP
ncbi:hypothetical protein BD626DRAFT_495154 [Schizophyllum amplum]|uniref:Uncharacterized protein n=1 Tax=Schizophyllum amplum TaxID=97359 RepID=A0A550CFZ0_9AGAR|nr:hypothetical protein BD626DRAFT_495154 [Auriculariopsis ampla]